jgi:hypothetical protein
VIAWTREVGNRTEIIHIEDVIDTIDASKSLVLKEMNYNDAIKDNPKAKQMYDRHKDILEILKARFVDMLNAPQPPKKIIPSKRYHK